MRTIILGLSGRKKSGKDTLAKYLEQNYGYKIYHFADPLKEFARDYLGLDEKLLWGTDEDKNTLTKYKFSDLYEISLSILNPKKDFDFFTAYINDILPENINDYMSYRQILQYFGTEVFRSFNKNIWIETTFRKIRKENPYNAAIADVRFPDEVNSIVLNGGEIVRLTRRMKLEDGKVEHISESALDDYSFFRTINNQELTLEQTFEEIDRIAQSIMSYGRQF